MYEGEGELAAHSVSMNESPEKEFQTEQEEALSVLQSEEFQNSFINALKDRKDFNTRNSSIELARLQGVYAQQLIKICGGPNYNNFQNENDLHLWDKTVKEIMFDDSNPNSLSRRIKEALPGKDINMMNEFAGATSILTFMSLWQEMHPNAADVSIEIANEVQDAINKVDIIIETEKRVTLCQLKTSTFNEAHVVRVTEIRDYFNHKVPKENIQEMIKEARVVKEQKHKPVDVIVAEVPGISAKCVGNVFGVVTLDRDEMVNSLKVQTQRQRLVPAAA